MDARPNRLPGPVWAVVVAAGRGQRFGAAKQYESVAGRRVLDWAVAAARAACDGVVLVVPPERVAEAEPTADTVVAGAATRSGSVRAGLAAVPTEVGVVVVHDAARPLASAGLFATVIAAVRDGHDAALPLVPLTDTIRTIDGETLDRSRLRAVQTPQGFRAGALRDVHAAAPEATDDASLVQVAGGRVAGVDGEPVNVKITTPTDLLLADLLLRR
ncbi:hypothetical protein BH24ACT3_BH24ACT3_16060 [soil metagenome]